MKPAPEKVHDVAYRVSFAIECFDDEGLDSNCLYSCEKFGKTPGEAIEKVRQDLLDNLSWIQKIERVVFVTFSEPDVLQINDDVGGGSQCRNGEDAITQFCIYVDLYFENSFRSKLDIPYEKLYELFTIKETPSSYHSRKVLKSWIDKDSAEEKLKTCFPQEIFDTVFNKISEKEWVQLRKAALVRRERAEFASKMRAMRYRQEEKRQYKKNHPGWLRRLFGAKTIEDEKNTVVKGPDQLDYRADGSIRPGDPAYDFMMNALKSDKAVIVDKDDSGNWHERS